MTVAAAPIGVFDSGIGGLSVLQALRHELPHEHFVYLADSGNAPYGERGDAFVQARTHAIAQYLRERHGIKALVIACNTATAAAVESLRMAMPDLPLIGVEPAIKPAALSSQTHQVGVMATRGTVESRRFTSCCKSTARGCSSRCRPAMGWRVRSSKARCKPPLRRMAKLPKSKHCAPATPRLWGISA